MFFDENTTALSALLGLAPTPGMGKPSPLAAILGATETGDPSKIHGPSGLGLQKVRNAAKLRPEEPLPPSVTATDLQLGGLGNPLAWPGTTKTRNL